MDEGERRTCRTEFEPFMLYAVRPLVSRLSCESNEGNDMANERPRPQLGFVRGHCALRDNGDFDRELLRALIRVGNNDLHESGATADMAYLDVLKLVQLMCVGRSKKGDIVGRHYTGEVARELSGVRT